MRRHVFHVAQHQRRPLSYAQRLKTFIEMSGFFAAQHLDICPAAHRVRQWLEERIDFSKVHAVLAAQEIDCRIARYPAQPLGGLGRVLQLVFALQSLDERVLRQILGIGYISDNSIDKGENTAKIVFDKAVLRFALGGARTRIRCRSSGHLQIFYVRCRRELHLSLLDAFGGPSVQCGKSCLRLNYMRPVHASGIGKTAFGAFADRSLKDLAVEAITTCLKDAGRTASDVEAFYLGNFDGPSFTNQNHLAPYVAGAAGISGIPATRFEAACASGGSAFFHAFQSVASCIYDTVLVCGVEKMTSQSTARVAEILAGAGDAQFESSVGATFPAIFAMIARRHMHQYGTTREHLAAVAVKNHYNASLNPQAHLKKIITIEQALAGKPVAEPFTIYDCSLVSDGAAAILISAIPHQVRIAACAQASGPVALADKPDITSFPATKAAAAKAYSQAGLSPQDIHLAEVHDCFTIAELIAMEDLGFIPAGQSGPWVASGATAITGKLPVNTSGGLKAKGHPVGATGVAQICDLVIQMRGTAGPRQVSRADNALAQNLGGSGATSVVTILQKS